MDVKQIYSFVNDATKQAVGEEVILAEDLSNIIDVGKAVFNANALDNYTRALVDRIGKEIFVARKYEGFSPSILMDSWEYGSVVEKIRCESPDAVENPTWKLTDGTVYEQDKFTAPKISVKFFNSKTTFEVPISIAERQVKESFLSADKLNGFIEMIYTAMDNGMTLKFDEMAQRLITNMVAETIHADYGTDALSSKSGVKAVNLLKLYNTQFGTTLSVAGALYDKSFLQFASLTVSKYVKRMQKMSTLFNISGTKKFTSRDLLHVILLSDYADATASYLSSSTYHDELVKLPKYEEVPYWQATGTAYGENGQINVAKIASDGKTAVSVEGILLGVIFDRDALGMTNYNKRVPSHRNDHAEFWNLWYKQDCSYFNDLDENFVCFFIQ